MAALKEKERTFLAENPFVGVVTDLRQDGSPHSTVVWVDVEDGKVSFNTARGRAKPKSAVPAFQPLGRGTWNGEFGSITSFLASYGSERS